MNPNLEVLAKVIDAKILKAGAAAQPAYVAACAVCEYFGFDSENPPEENAVGKAREALDEIQVSTQERKTEKLAAEALRALGGE